MKLIFNALILYHALESCTSFLIYQTMLGHHGFTQLERSLSYSSDASLSDSEALEEHFHGKSKHRHKHNDISSSTSESCSGIKCNCLMCVSKYDKCCKGFCEKNCPLMFNDYSYNSPLQKTPDVVVMPFPVPVMLVVNSSTSAINKTITPTHPTSSPTKAEKPDNHKHETKLPMKGDIKETEQSVDFLMDKSRFPFTFPIRTSAKSINTRKPDHSRYKPYLGLGGYTDHIRTSRRYPTFSIIEFNSSESLGPGSRRFSIITPRPQETDYRRQMNNIFPKSRLKTMPKYGLVNIPEVLKRMLKKLKNERKDLLEDKMKLAH